MYMYNINKCYLIYLDTYVNLREPNICTVIRHILTAGHCLCSQKDGHFKCLKGHVNQIRPQENEIRIYGGRKYQSYADQNNLPWGASEAYILASISKNIFFLREDIGIALIPDAFPNDQRFFDKKALLNQNSLRNADIVPICLGHLGMDLTGKTLTGAGWGLQYEEVPAVQPRDPLYSSCMTSELSLKIESRFRNCDMESIKANDYECRYDRPPIEMEEMQCKKYITKARRSMKKYLKKLVLPETFGEFGAINTLESIIVYITKKNGEEIACMGTGKDGWWRKAWKYGWCTLPKLLNENKKKWGVCSHSCSRELMKVTKSTIWCLPIHC